MKEFFNKIINGVTQYFKTFSSNTRTYFKINAVALLIIVAVITALTVWLWPSQKEIDKQVYVKNTEIAENFDDKELKVIDQQKELQLQLQLKEIKASRNKFGIIDWVLYSLIATVLTGMMATLLQAVYTKLKFTNNQESSHRVLSAALFSSALIVCVVFFIKFYPIVNSPN